MNGSPVIVFGTAFGAWLGCVVTQRRSDESPFVRRLKLLRLPFGVLALVALPFAVLDQLVRHASTAFLAHKTIEWMLEARAWLTEADAIGSAKVAGTAVI